MKSVIDIYKNIVIQIATPYSTGTGFWMKEYNLIITNEHVVRGNREVVIAGNTFPKQLARVLYTDPRYDLAFLETPKESKEVPLIQLHTSHPLVEGDQIVAIGHPFGLKYTATQGIISNTNHLQNDINYFQHDAALNPGNSGGPLVNKEGGVVGVNTFIIRNGNNIGFSLPAKYLLDSILEFQKAGKAIGARCLSCTNLVFEHTSDKGYCPHCGSKIVLPSEVEVYEPAGITKTIEEILEKNGYDIQLSRRGPNNWEISKGSAKINISYYEKTGLITGDAYLCTLPKKNIKPIYEFLLRQNYSIESLTFSVKDQDIILSLLIYDRYLNGTTGKKLFNHLFEKADYYDNILVEEYGAQWKN